MDVQSRTLHYKLTHPSDPTTKMSQLLAHDVSAHLVYTGKCAVSWTTGACSRSRYRARAHRGAAWWGSVRHGGSMPTSPMTSPRRRALRHHGDAIGHARAVGPLQCDSLTVLSSYRAGARRVVRLPRTPRRATHLGPRHIQKTRRWTVPRNGVPEPGAGANASAKSCKSCSCCSGLSSAPFVRPCLLPSAWFTDGGC